MTKPSHMLLQWLWKGMSHVKQLSHYQYRKKPQNYEFIVLMCTLHPVTNSLDRFRAKSPISTWISGSFNKILVLSLQLFPSTWAIFFETMTNTHKTISTLCNGTSKSVQFVEWRAAVPQAKFMLLLTDCSQVQEQTSDAAQTLKASSETQANPCYSRHLLVTNPENVMLIQPPMRIIGRTLVTFPFIISVSMVGSANHRRGVK